MGALAVSTLAECEAVIERGLTTFVEVGQALLRIRDKHLYPETHGTFEGYCRDRWGFTDRRARQLIAAADIGTIVPVASEGVARELAPLRAEPEQLREAWTEAVERNGSNPTAAQVREVVDDRTRGQLSNQAGGTDEWATPQDFFDVLNAEFGFELDVCALPSSAKCERFYSPADDGLSQPWTGICWMNPPYGDEIPHWVARASLAAESGATVVALVPARVDTGWWWDHCRHAEVRFLRGRLKFGGAETSAPFPSAVVVFGRQPAVLWWEWR